MIYLFDKMNAWIAYNTTYNNLIKRYITENESVEQVLSTNYFQKLPKDYQQKLDEMVDISEYDDFDISMILDTNSYEYVDPPLNATYTMDIYRRRMEQEMIRRAEKQTDL